MHLFKIDSIQCYPWHFAGTACLTLFFLLLPLTTKLNSAREKITIMSVHRPCIVCTDWAAVKEQRVQWHPAESEWEKVLECFEQGQKQSHHQVRHIYRMHKCMHSIKNFVLYGKCIIGGWDRHKPVKTKSLCVFPGIPLTERSKPVRWK